jgi:cytoskeletal protein CcmA (bactofilin family)
VIFSKKNDAFGAKPAAKDYAAPIPAREEIPVYTPAPEPIQPIHPMKPETTVLSAETEFKGDLGFSGDLHLNGRLEGSVRAEDGTLTVGEDALVKAEIHGQDVVVYGKVQGNITATGRLELRGQAQVYGDVRAAKFLIEENALFTGRSEYLGERTDEKPDFSRLFTKLKGDAKAPKTGA